MQLQGKKALVTGGTLGIGAAIAAEIARHGGDVAINGRNANADSQSLAEEIRGLGRQCAVIAADVGREDQANRCVNEAADALGGLDIVVHSAGGPSFGSIDDIDSAQWLSTFDAHVHGAFFLTKAALPLLRASDEASILLIASVAGIRGCAGAIAYGTAKGAVVQFTKMLARDVADENIRVNCLAPGVIRTRFHDKMTAAAKKHNLENRIPLHREGRPQDVAEAALFLLSNDYMTGEIVTIDGGLSMQVTR